MSVIILFYCFGFFFLGTYRSSILLQVPAAEWDCHVMSCRTKKKTSAFVLHDCIMITWLHVCELLPLQWHYWQFLCVFSRHSLTAWQHFWAGATVFGLQRVRTKDSMKSQNGVVRSLQTEKAGRRNRERIKYESTKIELELGCENKWDKKTVW